eukprot:NODE_108_length_18904_cov_0.654826.p3 type:complete len:466 gc:universal NODE_108_length_18904_cov_0.654826:15435-16832(+)
MNFFRTFAIDPIKSLLGFDDENSTQPKVKATENIRTLKKNPLIKSIRKSLDENQFQNVIDLLIEFASNFQFEADLIYAEIRLRNNGQWKIMFEKYKDDDNLPNRNLAMGLLYYFGFGIYKNKTYSLAEFEKISTSSAVALYFMGCIHYEFKRYEKAFECHSKSMDMNYNPAFSSLGWLYKIGAGVEKDIAIAKEHFEKSPKNPSSLFSLGKIYYESDDIAKSIDYFSRSSEFGCCLGLHFLGVIYWAGKSVERDEDTAWQYFNQAFELGSMDSLLFLGTYFKNKNDFEKAISYFKLAITKDIYQSNYRLGKLYLKNTKQFDLAIEQLKAGAQKNDPKAIFLLGDCYFKGHGVEKDIETAIIKYELAGSLGFADSYYKLSSLYKGKYGMPVDLAYHFKFLEKAAALNMPLACRKLALCYQTGSGVAISDDAAIECFEKAIQLGDKESKLLLERLNQKRYKRQRRSM